MEVGNLLRLITQNSSNKDYDRDSYDINKAAQDIAKKTLAKNNRDK